MSSSVPFNWKNEIQYSKVPSEEDFKTYLKEGYKHTFCGATFEKHCGEDWICPICKRTCFETMYWTVQTFPACSTPREDWIINVAFSSYWQQVACIQCVHFPQQLDKYCDFKSVSKNILSNFETSLLIVSTPHKGHTINIERAKRFLDPKIQKLLDEE